MSDSPAPEVISYQLNEIGKKVEEGFKNVGVEQGKTNAHLADLNGKVVKHEIDLTKIKTTNSFALWFVTVVGIPAIAFLLWGVYEIPKTVHEAVREQIAPYSPATNP